MSTASAIFLGAGIGFIAYPIFAVGCILVGAHFHETPLRLDEVKTGWWE
jgi:hypothetical protein